MEVPLIFASVVWVSGVWGRRVRKTGYKCAQAWTNIHKDTSALGERAQKRQQAAEMYKLLLRP